MRSVSLPGIASHGLIVALGALVAALDFASGPALHFPILFVLPVLFAVAQGRLYMAIALCVTLPVLRLLFEQHWAPLTPAGILVLNVATRALVLGFVAFEFERLRRARHVIDVLKGVIPVCAACKKIRDKDGIWQEMDAYVAAHTEAKFSHGVCPECFQRLYGISEPENR